MIDVVRRVGRRAHRSILTAMLVVLLVGATGCLSGAPPGQRGGAGERHSGEVEWWTINLQKNFGPYIQGLIDSYTRQHPDVKINWVDVPGQDITTKLLAAIAGGDVPDAVNITSASTGLFDDAMADLTPYVSTEEFAQYQPGLLGSLKNAAGQPIAVPWYNGGTSLGFYNTELLKGTGFNPARPPATVAEALELAREYHRATGEPGTGLMAYSTIVQQSELALISADRTKAVFNNAETADFLRSFKDAFDAGAIAPGALSADQRNPPQSLENRQIAFSPIAISSTLTNVEKNAPQVYDALAVVPALTGPSGRSSMPGQQVLAVPKGSANQAAAAEWIKFVTSAENQVAFCRLVPIYPSSVQALADPFFTEISGDTPSDRARRVLVETFPDSVDISLGSGNDEQLRLLFDEQVRAAMTGRVSIEEALATAERQWNDELAKSG